jgi:hypothetical protein
MTMKLAIPITAAGNAGNGRRPIVDYFDDGRCGILTNLVAGEYTRG